MRILHVEDCPREKKMRHCSLTTIRARSLKISSVMVFSLNLLKDNKLSKNKIQRLDLAFVCC